MNMCRNSFLAAVLAVFCAAAAFGSDPEIIGAWLWKAELGGPDEFTLVIVKAESGFAGTISDSVGMVKKETRVSEIKLGPGQTVTFQFPLADGAIIYCKLAVEQDKMTGTGQHPSGNSGALEFVRKK